MSEIAAHLVAIRTAQQRPDRLVLPHKVQVCRGAVEGALQALHGRPEHDPQRLVDVAIAHP